MNEEIERLLRLANIKDDDGYNTTDLTTSLQLFSELIVKECAKVCWNKYRNDDLISHNTGVMFSNDIKKHFGFEFSGGYFDGGE